MNTKQLRKLADLDGQKSARNRSLLVYLKKQKKKKRILASSNQNKYKSSLFFENSR